MSTQFQETYVKILSNPSIDYKAIALQLAVIDPEMFVECAKMTNPIANNPPYNELSEDEKEVLVWINRDGYIGAIRNHRIMYKTGLKEAKEPIDLMREKFYTMGFLKKEKD